MLLKKALNVLVISIQGVNMANIKGCLSHNSDDWKTPSELYDAFMNAGFVDCFPFKAEYDEFNKDYHHRKLFLNPPYSKLNAVVDWVALQLHLGNKIALLIPVRTDTRYFMKLHAMKCGIIFIQGRLHFNDSKTCAPFPSMLVLINFDFKEWEFTSMSFYDLIVFVGRCS